MACATVKLTTFLGHKKTITTLFHTCTNHFDHILSSEAVSKRSILKSALL
jgi:hypothetical protein